MGLSSFSYWPLTLGCLQLWQLDFVKVPEDLIVAIGEAK